MKVVCAWKRQRWERKKRIAKHHIYQLSGKNDNNCDDDEDGARINAGEKCFFSPLFVSFHFFSCLLLWPLLFRSVCRSVGHSTTLLFAPWLFELTYMRYTILYRGSKRRIVFDSRMYKMCAIFPFLYSQHWPNDVFVYARLPHRQCENWPRIENGIQKFAWQLVVGPDAQFFFFVLICFVSFLVIFHFHSEM